MNKTYCFTCGNKGFLDKPCPECGREPRNVSLNLDKMENTGDFVKKLDSILIPSKYHGVFFFIYVLERENANKVAELNDLRTNDLLFNRYTAQLDKINSIFSEGLLPHKSAIIMAPAGYSKMTFAYSCMQRAVAAGFKVAPLLDTGELKRVLILASERVNYRINGSMSYEEYIEADVCFVTVTKMYTRADAYEVIEELFDRRSRKGLSTFIISRFSIEEMSKNDKHGDFQAIKRYCTDDNKYPAIISYLKH